MYHVWVGKNPAIETIDEDQSSMDNSVSTHTIWFHSHLTNEDKYLIDLIRRHLAKILRN